MNKRPNFKEGDKVECIDDSPSAVSSAKSSLKKGEVYTVLEFTSCWTTNNREEWCIAVMKKGSRWIADRFKKVENLDEICANLDQGENETKLKKLQLSENDLLAYLEALDAVLNGDGLDSDSVFESMLHLRRRLRKLND